MSTFHRLATLLVFLAFVTPSSVSSQPSSEDVAFSVPREKALAKVDPEDRTVV